MKPISEYTVEDYEIVFKFWVESRNYFLTLKDKAYGLSNAGLCNSIAADVYNLMWSVKENVKD